MKSIFVLCGVLGAVSDASECQADDNSLLQARRVVRKYVQTDSKAVLKNMRGVANSLLEGSDTTMTSDEVNDALGAASDALAELSPAIQQQIENLQQQINDGASAVLFCHSSHQAELRSSLGEAAEEHAAAVENCQNTLDQLRADETRQCNIAEDCLCDEARVRTTDQEVLCTSRTETYEVAFCEHHHVCNIFYECHSTEADVFTRLRADVEAAMAVTVVEYIAVEQSRCLTGLIMEAMTPPLTPISHAALIACDDVEVSALQIDYPALPADPAACPAHAHGEPECTLHAPAPFDVQCAGRTTSGSTSWTQYNDNGIYVDVDTSQCGFQDTPKYVTSMGGSSSHWTSTGSSEIYNPTATGFRMYINNPGGITPSQANSWNWHVNWIADGIGVEASAEGNQIGQLIGDDRGVCAGKTSSGATNWVQYNANGIYLDVDTSRCGFQGSPVYVSSLGGNSHHWRSTGSSEIYAATATGFRMYVNRESITPSQANGWGWHVNWIGKGLEGQSEAHAPCSGVTVSGSTNWVRYTDDGIYLDVDTSACGFPVVPVYISSVGGRTRHWTSTGSSEIYSPTTTGFRMYLYKRGITPSEANSNGWHVNWMGSVPS